jgi:hypothetical protein
MMKNKSQSIIIITAILLAHAASATEFNINAIDKDLRSALIFLALKKRRPLRQDVILSPSRSTIFHWQTAGN